MCIYVVVADRAESGVDDFLLVGLGKGKGGGLEYGCNWRREEASWPDLRSYALIISLK